HVGQVNRDHVHTDITHYGSQSTTDPDNATIRQRADVTVGITDRQDTNQTFSTGDKSGAVANSGSCRDAGDRYNPGLPAHDWLEVSKWHSRINAVQGQPWPHRFESTFRQRNSGAVRKMTKQTPARNRLFEST